MCATTPSPQMVRSRFRSRVWTTRIVRGRLEKESHFSERAVNFVRANVMEPYTFPPTPDVACCFKHIKCAVDVRRYETPRPKNGTIHMVFSGKMDDCGYVVLSRTLVRLS